MPIPTIIYLPEAVLPFNSKDNNDGSSQQEKREDHSPSSPSSSSPVPVPVPPSGAKSTPTTKTKTNNNGSSNNDMSLKKSLKTRFQKPSSKKSSTQQNKKSRALAIGGVILQALDLTRDDDDFVLCEYDDAEQFMGLVEKHRRAVSSRKKRPSSLFG